MTSSRAANRFSSRLLEPTLSDSRAPEPRGYSKTQHGKRLCVDWPSPETGRVGAGSRPGRCPVMTLLEMAGSRGVLTGGVSFRADKRTACRLTRRARADGSPDLDPSGSVLTQG